MLMLDVMEVEEEEHDDLLADQDKYSWGRQVSVAHLGVVQVMPKGGWSELATTQSAMLNRRMAASKLQPAVRLLPNFNRLLVQLTQSGWECEDAILVVAVITVMRMPLAWALRDVIGPRWSGARAATAYRPRRRCTLSSLRTRSRTIHTTRRISPAFKLLLPATPFPLSPLCMRA